MIDNILVSITIGDALVPILDILVDAGHILLIRSHACFTYFLHLKKNISILRVEI